MKYLKSIIVFLVIVLLAGCGAVPAEEAECMDEDGHVFGGWETYDENKAGWTWDRRVCGKCNVTHRETHK